MLWCDDTAPLQLLLRGGGGMGAATSSAISYLPSGSVRQMRT
jgi:hypothetical protein